MLSDEPPDGLFVGSRGPGRLIPGEGTNAVGRSPGQEKRRCAALYPSGLRKQGSGYLPCRMISTVLACCSAEEMAAFPSPACFP